MGDEGIQNVRVEMMVRQAVEMWRWWERRVDAEAGRLGESV